MAKTGNGNRVAIVTLGCPKNEVDSECAARMIQKSGRKLVSDPSSAEYILVNTCGFIKEACDESIDNILDFANNTDGRIIVYGCMSARYGRRLFDLLPEVDLFMEGHDFKALPELLDRLDDGERRIFVKNRKKSPLYVLEDRFGLPGPTAYIKISEGCNRRCSFCTIPSIRGRMRCRPIGEIRREAEFLIKEGVKEIVLIAQDTSAYNTHCRGADGDLKEILVNIESLPGDFWIRILYLHPMGITDDLLNYLKNSSKVCRCLDVPFQHSSPSVLTAMRRGHGGRSARDIALQIREALPGWALRTTLMVGFPGESEKDFNDLLDFVSNIRIERMGAFIYSDEEGTSSSKMKHKVPAEVATERFEELMTVQRSISLEINRGLEGSTLKVLALDEFNGRTEWDAPEIDQEIHVESGGLIPGEFLQVKVTDSSEYDLFGEVQE